MKEFVFFKIIGVGKMSLLGFFRLIMLFILKCFFGVKGLKLFSFECFYFKVELKLLINFKFFFFVFLIIFGFKLGVVMY